jgi:pimeloyl-ACP methyl ester carboxylesterase
MSAVDPIPPTPMPMHEWPSTNGLRIRGDSWGDPSSPVVLLLHGGGQTRHSWKATGQKLASSGYYAVAFDARGHGDSEWDPDGAYSQDAQVEDLKNVIAGLGGPQCACVGASMGGITSLLAIGEGHIDAIALVLVDMAARLETDGAEKIVAFMRQRPEGFDSLEEVAEAIAAFQPHRPRPKSLSGLAKNVRLWQDGKYHWHWDPRISTRVSDTVLRQSRLEACARALRLPTLLIRGGLSDVLSEEGAKELLALSPHAEYINVPDATHMVAGDRNDVFGDAMVDFLSRTVPVLT